MKPRHRIAALAVGATFLWGSAHASPETPEPVQEIPVIILEVQPGPQGSTGTAEQEQALLSMLLLQLLLGGVEVESGTGIGSGGTQPAVVTPKEGEHRI